MSRNGSGTYTLPSGNPVVSGTLIEASWANTTLSDLASAMTDSLSRSGQGGMTAAFRAFDGTSSVPGLAWGSETTTGWYRAGAGDMRLVITGSQVIQYLSTGVAVTGTLSVSGNTTLSGGTANGVAYLNGSKVLTTGSALTFDGTNFGVGTSSPAVKLQVYNNINGTPFAWGNATRTGYLYQDALGVGITNASGTGFDEGVYLDTANNRVVLYTNSTERVILDSFGNLGLGVAPSAWNSAYRAIDVGNSLSLIGGSGAADLYGNAFVNSGGGFIYRTNAAASAYSMATGAHRWYTAPSGTAGNAISFTQAMTLDASGRLGIGITSPSTRLHVVDNLWLLNEGGAAAIIRQSSANGNNGLIVDVTNTVGQFVQDWRIGNSSIARITGGGALLVGPGAVDDSGRMTISGANGYANNGLSIYETSTGNARRLRMGQESSGFVYNATWSSGGNAHIWQIGGSEAARIDVSNNLLVGVTSSIGSNTNTSNGAQISKDYTWIATTDSVYIQRPNGTDGAVMQFLKNAGALGSISLSGSSTAYNTSSDYRLKENIQPMTGALAFVRKQRPVTYNWKADGSEGAGYIAHWMQEDGAGNCVTGTKDAVDADGQPVYQGIDTSVMVAPLNAAIDELAEIVEAQAAIINQLKADVAALKGA